MKLLLPLCFSFIGMTALCANESVLQVKRVITERQAILLADIDNHFSLLLQNLTSDGIGISPMELNLAFAKGYSYREKFYVSKEAELSTRDALLESDVGNVTALMEEVPVEYTGFLKKLKGGTDAVELACRAGMIFAEAKIAKMNYHKLSSSKGVLVRGDFRALNEGNGFGLNVSTNNFVFKGKFSTSEKGRDAVLAALAIVHSRMKFKNFTNPPMEVFIEKLKPIDKALESAQPNPPKNPRQP